VAVPPAAKFFLATILPFTEPLGVHLSRRVAARPFELVNNADGVTTNHIVTVSKCARDAVHHLQANSSLQLAHRFAVAALATCTQHALVNDGEPSVGETLAMVAPRASSVAAELAAGILAKTLGAAVIDRFVALGIMAELPVAAGFQAFQVAVSQAKKQYDKLHDLAILGTAFALVWNEAALVSECCTLGRNASFWKVLQAKGVAFDRRQFEADPVGQTAQLLPTLLVATGLDLAQAREWAHVFGVAPATSILAFIRQTLIKSLSARSTQSIVHACSLVEDRSVLGTFLFQDCLLAIDGRDYERLRFVMSTVLEHAGGADEGIMVFCRNGLMLLDILKSYIAVTTHPSPPALCPLGVLPFPTAEAHIARTRLPFHALMRGDPWQIIKDELCLENYKKLLPLTSVLDIHGDSICMAVIEKVLASGDAIDPTTLQPVIVHISQPKVAILAAKSISDRASTAANKATALQYAKQIALSWQPSVPASTAEGDEALAITTKLQAACAVAETEADLIAAQVSDPSVLACLKAPSGLITKLYERYTVNADWAGGLQALIELCDRIAERFGLSGPQLRRKFILSNLQSDREANTSGAHAGAAAPSASSVAAAAVVAPSSGKLQQLSGLSLSGLLDEDQPTSTATLGLGAASSSEAVSKAVTASEWDERMHKAVALLRLEDMGTTIGHLTKGAFGDFFPAGQWRSRLRALLALIVVAPADMLCAALNEGPQWLRERYLSLSYACRLCDLFIPQTPDEFAASSKEALVRGLWRTHNTRPAVVRTLCEICLDFHIADGALWDALLSQLMAARDYAFAQAVLSTLSGCDVASSVASLSSTWRELFAKAPLEGVDGTLLACAALRCPTLLQLDLTPLWTRAVSVGDAHALLHCLRAAAGGILVAGDDAGTQGPSSHQWHRLRLAEAPTAELLTALTQCEDVSLAQAVCPTVFTIGLRLNHHAAFWQTLPDSLVSTFVQFLLSHTALMAAHLAAIRAAAQWPAAERLLSTWQALRPDVWKQSEENGSESSQALTGAAAVSLLEEKLQRSA
jgi:hypothetical protein